MAEYIERETAKKMFEDDYNFDAATAIDRIPSVEVVEVIRCKECQSYYSIIVIGDKEFCGCSYMGRDVKPNGFCSYGKRKDGKR